MGLCSIKIFNDFYETILYITGFRFEIKKSNQMYLDFNVLFNFRSTTHKMAANISGKLVF